MVKHIFNPFLALLILSILFFTCTPKIKQEVRASGPSIRILLSTIADKDSLTFNGTYILHSEEARYEFGERNKIMYINPLNDGLQLYNENRNLLYRDYFPIMLEPMGPDSRFLFHGEEYGGSVYFQPAANDAVMLINKIMLEEYLKGVVPAEIPTLKEADFEAMKAQAICARTYALQRMENNRDLLYDVKSTVSDQVYSGFARHSRFADQAIAETKGVVLTYNDRPATVYYHSTCGGRLERAENLWPDKQLPYLEGGIDAVSAIYSCSASPYFRWLETRSFSQLDSAFYQQYNRRRLQETVTDTLKLNFHLNILKRNSTGRVSELEIAYADTTVILSGYEIRRFFTNSEGKMLPSNLFYLTQPDDSTLVIHGGGYGHGVGMCQYGALNMARRGLKHYHILGKYYPGTKLFRKY